MINTGCAKNQHYCQCDVFTLYDCQKSVSSLVRFIFLLYDCCLSLYTILYIPYPSLPSLIYINDLLAILSPSSEISRCTNSTLTERNSLCEESSCLSECRPAWLCVFLTDRRFQLASSRSLSPPLRRSLVAIPLFTRLHCWLNTLAPLSDR